MEKSMNVGWNCTSNVLIPDYREQPPTDCKARAIFTRIISL